VVPEFYSRDAQGVPTAWVARMRESMARLAPRFSTGRTVRKYTERYYLPAATAYHQRAADKGTLGARVLDWQLGLVRQW
jgi:starch phosphorylase